jgi:hypothetical protein
MSKNYFSLFFTSFRDLANMHSDIHPNILVILWHASWGLSMQILIILKFVANCTR